MSSEPEPSLPEVDADGFTERELIDHIGAADAIEARSCAMRLLSVARWARRRRGPALAADGRGGPGVDTRALADDVLAGVREDFVSELALSRSCSEAEAHVLLREALVLTGPLAPVWSRLSAGTIGVRHAKAAVDLLGDVPPEVAAEVQARVLPRVEGMGARGLRHGRRTRADVPGRR